MVICPDIDLDEPDEIAARVWANLDHSSHYHTVCSHRANVSSGSPN